jgi:hypothetical protein
VFSGRSHHRDNIISIDDYSDKATRRAEKNLSHTERNLNTSRPQADEDLRPNPSKLLDFGDSSFWHVYYSCI